MADSIAATATALERIFPIIPSTAAFNAQLACVTCTTGPLINLTFPQQLAAVVRAAMLSQRPRRERSHLGIISKDMAFFVAAVDAFAAGYEACRATVLHPLTRNNRCKLLRYADAIGKVSVPLLLTDTLRRATLFVRIENQYYPLAVVDNPDPNGFYFYSHRGADGVKNYDFVNRMLRDWEISIGLEITNDEYGPENPFSSNRAIAIDLVFHDLKTHAEGVPDSIAAEYSLQTR